MFLVAACALAAPSVLFRTAPKLSAAWVAEKTQLEASTPVKFMISMERDASLLAAAKARIEEVANPESPDFREWLTPDETHTVAAPRKGALAAVSSWLVKAGIRGITRRAHVFEIRTTAGQVEALLRTRFTVVREVATGKTHRVAGDLHLPSDVAPHVATIYGLHGLPLPPRKPRAVKKLGDEPAVGPVELRQVYSVTKSRGSGSVKVRQAVAEFQGQYVQQSDLTDFFQDKTLVPMPKTGDDQIYKTIGDMGSGDGVEALLDVEYIMGVALGVKTEFWSFQQMDFCSDLKNWTSTMLADTSDQPLVISVSYGWQGDLSQLGCTTAEVADIDKDFMQIAGVGITIVFSSGDSGSGWDGTQLWPEWPCSSPWITSVGSTAFTGAVGSQQQATTQFGSGSGFSTMFTAASWQTRAVRSTSPPPPGSPPRLTSRLPAAAPPTCRRWGRTTRCTLTGL